MLALAVYINIGPWEMLALAGLLLLLIILRARAATEDNVVEVVPGGGMAQSEDGDSYPDWGPNGGKRVGFQAPKRSKP